ncbi:MAG: hypothetical protein ABIC19_00570 [Patescibacteria group bacterium]|nr:hypothetical protein [Patescibacteria group bacterium]
MEDFLAKTVKFILFLVWVFVLIVVYAISGWGGVLVVLLITGGAFAIFGD